MSTKHTAVELSGDPVADGQQAEAALKAQPPAPAAPAAGDPQVSAGSPGPDGQPAEVPVTDFSFVEREPEGTPAEKAAAKWVEDGEVEEQLNKNGKFSQYFKDKLTKKGMAADMVDMLEQGAIARRGAVLSDFAKHAGGENFQAVLAWAKEHLPAEDKTFYNARAQSKDANDRRAAARDLLARYNEAGAAPASQLDGVGRGYQGYTNPLGKAQTPDAMVALLNDPRNLSGGQVKHHFDKNLGNAAAEFADSMGIVVRAHR